MAKTQRRANVAFDHSVKRSAASPARATARRFAIEPPADRGETFAKARRHSARVRFLRAAIPIGGLGAIAAMVAFAFFNPFSSKLGGLTFSALSLDGSKITMERPKLTGFRSDGQPYVLTADRALQDMKQPTIVELKKVDGEIGMANGQSTHLSAETGVYDSVNEHMELSKNVRITNDRLDVTLRSARFDFKSGVYQTDEPVEVHVGDDATILSDRGAARNNGQELTFEGRVRTRIVPKAAEPADLSKRTDR